MDKLKKFISEKENNHHEENRIKPKIKETFESKQDSKLKNLLKKYDVMRDNIPIPTKPKFIRDKIKQTADLSSSSKINQLKKHSNNKILNSSHQYNSNKNNTIIEDKKLISFENTSKLYKKMNEKVNSSKMNDGVIDKRAKTMDFKQIRNYTTSEINYDNIDYENQNEDRHRIKNKLLKDLYDENEILKEKLSNYESLPFSLSKMDNNSLIDLVINKSNKLSDMSQLIKSNNNLTDSSVNSFIFNLIEFVKKSCEEIHNLYDEIFKINDNYLDKCKQLNNLILNNKSDTSIKIIVNELISNNLIDNERLKDSTENIHDMCLDLNFLKHNQFMLNQKMFKGDDQMYEYVTQLENHYNLVFKILSSKVPNWQDQLNKEIN